MHEILTQLNTFLAKAGNEPVQIDEPLIEAFGEHCKAAVRKALIEPKQEEFRLRLSNVGRPSCQLHMEKNAVQAKPRTPASIISGLYGDMIEGLTVLLLQASGINVTTLQEKVTLELDEYKISGTLDLTINNEVWDVKTASSYAFKHKFDSFDALLADDPFGYIPQLVCYSVASGRRAGGWIVIDKTTGEFKILEVPKSYEYKDALDKVRSNLSKLGEEFVRQFTDEPEIFNKKPTGNRELGISCEYCPYNNQCWPSLSILPRIPSNAKSKELVYYTHVTEAWRDYMKGKEE